MIFSVTIRKIILFFRFLMVIFVVIIGVYNVILYASNNEIIEAGHGQDTPKER
jgi:hypothetical protein